MVWKLSKKENEMKLTKKQIEQTNKIAIQLVKFYRGEIKFKNGVMVAVKKWFYFD